MIESVVPALGADKLLIDNACAVSFCFCGSGRNYGECCLGGEHEMAVRRRDFALDELANGRPAAAVTALKEALALEPGLVLAHNDLGMALKDLGRLDEAEAAYRDALHLDATCVAAYYNLGEVLQLSGRLEEARQCFESVLRVSPAHNQSRIRLANTLADLGELEAAAACYKESIARSPGSAGVYTPLGIVLWKLGNSAGALDAFERSVAASPASAEAHYNLGCALLDLGRSGEALQSGREALRLRPGFSEALGLCAAGLAATDAMDAAVELVAQSTVREVPRHQPWMRLATRLMESRLFGPARGCLKRALQEEPGDVRARHLLAALSGENPDQPVDGYVRQLFNDGAATFDLQVASKLGYGIPREMVQAIRATEGPPAPPWKVLDLGCGTGLVGLEISSDCRQLVGIDLAPNMIERARNRRIYTELCCVDLITALSMEDGRQERFDVVTAADVFIYVGKLDAVIPAVRRVLNSGGLFAFSAEAIEVTEDGTSEGYRLGVMGRYAHGADYLRQLAEQNRFQVELLRKTRIRLEHRRPVDGWLTIWRAV